MASSKVTSTKKKVGRPASGVETPVQVRFPSSDLKPLDDYASDEALTRQQAIRAIVAEWLRTHGYGDVSSKKPEGPATRVVADMDAAIKEHKRSSKSSAKRD